MAKEDLLNFINKFGRLPVCRELGPPNTTYTEKVYYKYWGGIEGCVNSIGLDYSKLKNLSSVSNVNLRLDEIIKFKTIHNRWPETNEFHSKNNLPSNHWIHEHFGNYENLKNYFGNSIDTNTKV